jgi:hypothetical protein
VLPSSEGEVHLRLHQPGDFTGEIRAATSPEMRVLPKLLGFRLKSYLLKMPASISGATRRLRMAARLLLVGWAILIPTAYLLERLSLLFAAHHLGPSWFPTVRLAVDCLALAITGWVIGRLDRSTPVFGAILFAATLTLIDTNPLLTVNVPWLVGLSLDALRDPVYLDSWAATAVQHIFLFGSLFAGALLSRPMRAPVSLFARPQ